MQMDTKKFFLPYKLAVKELIPYSAVYNSSNDMERPAKEASW